MFGELLEIRGKVKKERFSGCIDLGKCVQAWLTGWSFVSVCYGLFTLSDMNTDITPLSADKMGVAANGVCVWEVVRVCIRVPVHECE